MAEETKPAGAEPQESRPDGNTDPAEKTYTEAEYNALQEQLKAVNDQLSNANKSIRSYKDMDIDSIKQSAADWEQKYKAAEQQRAAQEYSTKLDKFVAQQGCKNAVYADYLKRQLEGKQLKFDGDTLLGGEDVVKALKESCPDAFTADKPLPTFVGSTPGSTNKNATDDMIRRVMGLK